MLQKLKQKKSDGFTIIEVLIVLAIAGLILLIVFLAVPNLQRTSRNTQRKNDVAAISSAISNFMSNNGGVTPSTVAGDGTSNSNLVVGAAAAVTPNTETAKLGYYTVASSATAGTSTTNGSDKITIIKSPGAATVATPSGTAVPTEQVVIDVGYTCNSSNTDIGNPSPRTVSLIYWTETGSGSPAKQCLES